MKYQSKNMYQFIHISAIMLAIIVVSIGAYTRLKHAGLGCPDWPKCFQHWIVKPTITSPSLTQEGSTKAWIEMIHRYAAGLLCLTLLKLKIVKYTTSSKHTIINIILALTSLQAAFGMWTVTWKLHPLAVMPHLIGGMSITTLLCMDFVKNQRSLNKKIIPRSTKKILTILLIALLFQVILGGWTSANYAALVCPDFPTCQGQWIPKQANFVQGFSLPLGHQSYEGGVLSGQARIAIHTTHRIGALICTILLLLLTSNIIQNKKSIAQSTLTQYLFLMFLFTLQITLGILNIFWQLPIKIALGHNVIALALIIQCTVILICSKTKKQSNSLNANDTPNQSFNSRQKKHA